MAMMLRPSLKTISGFALLASAASLGTAFVAQYGFGLAPCELCLMQRVPYALVIVLAVAGFWLPRWRRGFALLIGGIFVVGSCIASYHGAVEKGWVKGPVACTDSGAPSASVDDFLKKIQAAPVVACDKPAWDFHGITMADLNALWSLLLATFVFAALQRNPREESHA